MGVVNRVENRWSKRRSLELSVEVIDQGITLAKSRTRDLGLGGVFVEWVNFPLEENSVVDLLFNLDDAEGRSSKHRLHAKVVRVDDDGVGLSFQDFDTCAFRALQALINQHQGEAAAIA
ncbi:MAG: PilZ domain-containing protein [Gammaproteobacteria bacterium]|nr:PilZ domain-containing protein [Gammaproteobacteria bacterium]